MAIKPTGSKGQFDTNGSKLTCNFKGCTKSLKLVDQVLKCRCEGMFCKKHRDVVAHHCKINPALKSAAAKTRGVFEQSNQEGSAY